MPEIDHKTPVAGPTKTVTPAPAVEKALETAGVTTSDLEQQVAAILAKRRADAVEAAKPKEPDWASLTERDAMSPTVYIPIIDHDVPDYMNIKLKDTEYEPVWASKDQRRIGQLLAEGYEFIKPEHIAGDFKLPLKFDSEQHYTYQDVVALRAHKRVIFGKRRKAFELSQRQLANKNKLPQQRIKDTFELSSDFPELEAGLKLYDTART